MSTYRIVIRIEWLSSRSESDTGVVEWLWGDLFVLAEWHHANWASVWIQLAVFYEWTFHVSIRFTESLLGPEQRRLKDSVLSFSPF